MDRHSAPRARLAALSRHLAASPRPSATPASVPASSGGDPPSRALEGVRVLEMATVIAGPMSAAILGDLGAIVTKVESPEGDTGRSRHVRPPPQPGQPPSP